MKINEAEALRLRAAKDEATLRVRLLSKGIAGILEDDWDIDATRCEIMQRFFDEWKEAITCADRACEAYYSTYGRSRRVRMRRPIPTAKPRKKVKS